MKNYEIDLLKLESYTDDEIKGAKKALNNEYMRRVKLSEEKQRKEWDESGILNCYACGEKLVGRMEMMLGYCEECN